MVQNFLIYHYHEKFNTRLERLIKLLVRHLNKHWTPLSVKLLHLVKDISQINIDRTHVFTPRNQVLDTLCP